MFHEGDVQSGIALAVQNGKSVVCFVTDGGEESQKWENQWLQEHNLPSKLESKAVTLRIEKDSEAAQQLSAFYPLQDAPALLIISQGKLNTQLRAGTSENDFALSILKGLHPNMGQSASPLDGVPEQTTPRTTVPTTRGVEARLPTPATASAAAQTIRETGESSDVAKPQASGETPRATYASSTPSTGLQQDTYAQRQARAKQEARKERERVRALIEADKQSRKAQEEQRRQEVREVAAEEERQTNATQRRQPQELRGQTTNAGSSISVRLLDGSSMRQKFDAGDTLYSKVRPWIDASRTDSTAPYTFKAILTPQPSRAFDDADEKKTLAELGLVPSASIVLVPIQNFAEAYRSNGSMGFITSTPSLVYGYFVALFTMILEFVQRLVDRGRTARESAPSTPIPQSAERADKTSKIRVKTLQDQQDGTRDDQQLYNGNTLNFEPQKKDKEDG